MAKKYTADQMIEAIREAEGNLSHAARLIGCTRATVHRYVNNYPTVEKAYHEANDVIVDIAEDQLIRLVKKGSFPAIKYFLSTKGKSRGYVERQEVTGAEGDALRVQFVWQRSDDDEDG